MGRGAGTPPLPPAELGASAPARSAALLALLVMEIVAEVAKAIAPPLAVCGLLVASVRERMDFWLPG